MTPLKTLRRIHAAGPPTYEDTFCDLCGEQVRSFGVNPPYAATPHRPTCPWLAMPKIIAALEAAEAVVASFEANPRMVWDNPTDELIDRLSVVMDGDEP